MFPNLVTCDDPDRGGGGGGGGGGGLPTLRGGAESAQHTTEGDLPALGADKTFTEPTLLWKVY